MFAEAPQYWSAADFGQGHGKGGTKQHIANRGKALDRMLQLGGPMPPVFDWQYFRDAFSVQVGKQYGPAVGAYLRNELKRLKAELAADPKVFQRWVRKESKALPLAELVL